MGKVLHLQLKRRAKLIIANNKAKLLETKTKNGNKAQTIKMESILFNKQSHVQIVLITLKTSQMPID